MEVGDRVKIYNRKVCGEAEFEGNAVVNEILSGHLNSRGDRAMVTFLMADGFLDGPYERYVDPYGQGGDPEVYVNILNIRLAME